MHLTDARYFAAWGVDYLALPMFKTEMPNRQLDYYKEIIDWLEGPIIVGDFNNMNEAPLIRDRLVKLGIRTGIFGSMTIIDQCLDLLHEVFIPHAISSASPPGHKVILPLQFVDTVSSDSDIEYFVDGIEGLESVEECNPNFGLILNGSSQEKTGFKNFDELDAVFEFLSEHS